MTEENILRALRSQAWERAKGEMRSVMHTFFGVASARPGQFEEYSKVMAEFVHTVESEGLVE